MGYGINRFVSNVDPNLVCSVCSAVLDDPVLTPCGHSFCCLCLETWLANPGCQSCPECRGRLLGKDTHHIRSLRNLINGLEVNCDHKSRGCSAMLRLEDLQKHLDTTCERTPVACAGCGLTVDRCQLPEHHLKCDVINAVIHDDVTSSVQLARAAAKCGVVNHRELSRRVSSLEIELARVKRDLEIAHVKNKRAERELKKTHDDLEMKRGQLLDYQYAEFDPDYEHGYLPDTIAKLARFIARFLLKKPAYVDRDGVFGAIKRTYDKFARCGNEYEHDVHMLLATAYASGWFSDKQKGSFSCWLQTLVRAQPHAMHP